MWCKRLNPGWPRTRQVLYLLYYLCSPVTSIEKKLNWMALIRLSQPDELQCFKTTQVSFRLLLSEKYLETFDLLKKKHPVKRQDRKDKFLLLHSVLQNYLQMD